MEFKRLWGWSASNYEMVVGGMGNEEGPGHSLVRMGKLGPRGSSLTFSKAESISLWVEVIVLLRE